MIEHTHLLYVVLAIGAILVVLYTTGNLNNTSNVVVIMLFAITALAMVLALERPSAVKVPAVSAGVTTGGTPAFAEVIV